MKLLNSEVIYEISKMGHFNKICIADSGLPIPKNVKRIDLAVSTNVPSFIDVFTAIQQNICVQKTYLASEIKQKNTKILNQVESVISKEKIEFIKHSDFKEMLEGCVAVVRTGECTSYANIILEVGVNFNEVI